MRASASSPTRASARLFGIPFGDFGLFASILIALAMGFMTFFAMTFFSIFALMFYNGATHHHVGLDAGYKYFAFPAGLLVLAVSLAVLVGFWLRNRLSGQREL